MTIPIRHGPSHSDSEISWKNSYPPEVPLHMEYRKITISRLLQETSEKYPHHRAISFMGFRMTYRELWNDVCRFANALVHMGVKPGDAICIMLPNCPQTVTAFYGALLAGAVVVMTNPLYVERELQYQLQDSGAKVIIVLDLLDQRVMRAIEQTKIEQVVFTGIQDYLVFPKNLIYSVKMHLQGKKPAITYNSKVHRWKEILEKGSIEAYHPSTNVDDVALLQYTGGTTGTPKGVMLSHWNINANTQQLVAWFYKCEFGNERILCVLPFFHVYGLTIGMNLAVAVGAEMILLPRFDGDKILQTIDRERPTMFPGTPTMYISIINHPKVSHYDLSSVKACLSGAAGLPVEVQQSFEKLTGGRLVEGYGLTEASPVTHCIPIWHKRKSGSIGLPLPDTEVKIIDLETGEPIIDGRVGELIVKGPQVMKGYWNRPDETKEVLRDGWLYTGDLSLMDDEGFFYIVDRKKDLIIAGGYNIYPREVEEVLYEHPSIQEAVVLGVPDPYRGETVKAYIVLKEGKQPSLDEIEVYCRSKLASYKIPRTIEFRTELPKTISGKILRRRLLEEGNEAAASKA
ncbi:AMP-binding protein [Heliobacillus mobilis]|uniref:AMP-binding protein n=1 Tax=Heliobacterium mobile TaxID=28064 RepID=A0A6I3SPE6_HELMO|nr:long-chain fatty acid--CoA ligase [Heliobacterium mobile]MTV50759.1 AMP-binding protein [Heliobacterium mobile]